MGGVSGEDGEVDGERVDFGIDESGGRGEGCFRVEFRRVWFVYLLRCSAVNAQSLTLRQWSLHMFHVNRPRLHLHTDIYNAAIGLRSSQRITIK